MRCREPRLHPSCGLVQKPFVPIVHHNLFSQRLQREGYGGDKALAAIYFCANYLSETAQLDV